MTKLTKPRAILFDWDNTLVNTWPLIHSALNMTLRHMDHPEWTYDRVRSEVKQSMRDSFPVMFGDKWEDAAAHYRKSYRSIHLDQLVPLPDVEIMLEAIRRPFDEDPALAPWAEPAPAGYTERYRTFCGT